MPTQLDRNVEAELERLSTLRIKELRALWRARFKSDPPPAFGPDLLRRSLAYKVQEKAYGGLDRETARSLANLMAQHDKTPGKLVLPRRIKPGAVLVRHFKGVTHRVTVTANGYAYQNRPYESLSEIARAITGTRWNGPRFFGLRKGQE
jgi:hypothetical protein